MSIAPIAAGPPPPREAPARRARKDFKTPRVWVALRSGHVGVEEENVLRLGGHVLFGGARRIPLWISRLERGAASVERWRRGGS